jgi:K+ transporter
MLAIGELGVVYGDIGTNPLFAMREAFVAHSLPVTSSNIFGLLSLIFWSLILVISVKYVSFVMRANNDGEGGILALVALIRGGDPSRRRRHWVLILLGLFGAALLYGDGVITPSISVLAAVEGTTVATPGLRAIVVPLAVVVLVLLFLIPAVNWLLMLACVGLVVGFRRSENLAGAYGLAVSGTMLISGWGGRTPGGDASESRASSGSWASGCRRPRSPRCRWLES